MIMVENYLMVPRISFNILVPGQQWGRMWMGMYDIFDFSMYVLILLCDASALSMLR